MTGRNAVPVVTLPVLLGPHAGELMCFLEGTEIVPEFKEPISGPGSLVHYRVTDLGVGMCLLPADGWLNYVAEATIWLRFITGMARPGWWV